MLTSIRNFDGNLLIDIQELLVRDWVTPIVRVFTHTGDKGIFIIALVLVLLCFKKTRRVGLLAGLSLLSTFIIVNLCLKNLVDRTRPYEVFEQVNLLIAKEHDASFPSGHTANTLAVMFMLFLQLPKKYGVPALTYGILIALSRLYVGVHYPLDVLCGAIIAVCVVLIIKHIDDRMKAKNGIGVMPFCK